MTESTKLPVKAGSKHSEISRQLLQDIATGKYAPGARLPTESELAQQFEVSRPTISQALRHLQVKGLISRRAGSGTYVLRTETKEPALKQLGFLVPGVRMTGIFEIMCTELANLARAKNYFLVWGGSNYTPSERDMSEVHAMELCEQFINQGVNGVFFAPFELTEHPEEASAKITKRFQQANIPLVLIDRDIVPFPRRSKFDLITVDNIEGGYLLADHLLQLGCRRIAFCARANSAPSVLARMAGVREALANNGLIETKGWIKIGDPEDKNFAQQLASEKWDGVVCANDMTAANLLRSLEKIDVRVPQDLRLVGFDDAKFAALLGVSLTTVRQPCENMAITAFHALQDRIEEPKLPARNMTLSPQLIVRESCGAHAHPPKPA